jgi:hypothetical protein
LPTGPAGPGPARRPAGGGQRRDHLLRQCPGGAMPRSGELVSLSQFPWRHMPIVGM